MLLYHSLALSLPALPGSDGFHVLFFELDWYFLHLLTISYSYRSYRWCYEGICCWKHAIISFLTSYPSYKYFIIYYMLLITCVLKNIYKSKPIFFWLHSLLILYPAFHFLHLDLLEFHSLRCSHSHPYHSFVNLCLSFQ